jgi:cytochrome P450
MLLADLDLPTLELAQPGMVGDRLHATLAATRAESWIARNNAGVSILEREAAEFFLKSPALEFPGAVMMELMGITDGPIHRVMERGLLGRSGADHKRLRRLVSRSFTPRAADRWRAVMREQLHELWSAVDGARSIDAMTAFARPFPSRMIALIVGAPVSDAEQLRHYSAVIQQRLDFAALQTRRSEIEAGTAEFEAYVEQLVADHRRDPQDDLVTELIDTDVDGDRLDNDDVVSLVMAMLSGGIDTTENQLAHGLRLFAEHPDQWEALAAEPNLAKAAADEVLRFEPVSPFTVRIVRDEVVYRDVVFPSGTIVLVCTWSANREGRGDERPTDFDITASRGTDRPLSFGAGPHYCLGAGLAWAELEEAFAFLATKMCELRFGGDVEWGSPIGIYDIVSLPLAFTERPST